MKYFSVKSAVLLGFYVVCGIPLTTFAQVSPMWGGGQRQQQDQHDSRSLVDSFRQEEAPVTPDVKPLPQDQMMPNATGLVPIDYMDNNQQAQSLLGKKVVDIQIRGLRNIDADTALSRITLKKGNYFKPSQISADIQSLFQSGFFRDIAAYVEPLEPGVRIIFFIREHPTIRTISFEGNDELSEDDLKEQVDLKQYTVLNKSDLKRNIIKIKDSYVDKGYYLAEIRYRLEEVAEGTMVDVIFEIDERQEVQIYSITFVGNEFFTSDQLKGILQTREGGFLSSIFGTGTFKDEHLQMDVMRIQSYYYDHGFIKVKVGSPEVTISDDLTRLYILIPIEEGPQYTLGKIDFAGDVELKDLEGKVVIDQVALNNRLTIKSNEIFNRSKLFADVQGITTLYQDQGYAYANVIPDSRPGDDLIVDITIRIEKGNLVRFGRIDIYGNTLTRDKVIRREMRIVEGELYSATGLNRSKARAYQLGFFETVDITTNPSQEPNVVDVSVRVKEKPSGAFQLGAGYSSLEGFVMTGQITQNNFLGRGQYFALQAQLSFGAYGRKLATLQFSEPYFLDSQWSMTGRVFLTQELYRSFQRNSQGFSPGFGYWLTDDLRLSLSYTLEWVETTTDTMYNDGTGVVLNNLNTKGRSSAVSLTMSYDTRDNRLFPTKGQYHVFSTEVAGPYFGSELDFKRYIVNLHLYQPIVWQLVFKTNLRVGYITSADDQVPFAERFFPGGIYTLRGFEYRSLGPQAYLPLNGSDPLSPNGPPAFPLGGNKQFIANFELEFPLLAQAGLKGVIFLDAGNAYGENENFFYLNQPDREIPSAYLMGSGREVPAPLGLYYSFGFGFRWYSPIGLLRFEWGVPITKKSPDDRSIQFEFTIGAF